MGPCMNAGIYRLVVHSGVLDELCVCLCVGGERVGELVANKEVGVSC